MAGRKGRLIVEATRLNGEEVFVLWLVDFGKGTVLASSKELAEPELRQLLGDEYGMPNELIEQHIYLARRAYRAGDAPPD